MRVLDLELVRDRPLPRPRDGVGAGTRAAQRLLLEGVEAHAPVVEAPVVTGVREPRAFVGDLDPAPLDEAVVLAIHVVAQAEREPRDHERSRGHGGRSDCGGEPRPPRHRQSAHPPVEQQPREPHRHREQHRESDHEHGVLPLRHGSLACGVLRHEQVGVVGGQHRDGAGRDDGEQPGERAPRPGEHEVEDDADGGGRDRPAREREVQRGGEHGRGPRAQHPQSGRLALARRQMDREYQPDSEEEAEPVPVGERVAESLRGDVLVDRQHLGQHPGQQREHANYEHRAEQGSERPRRPLRCPRQ